MALQDVYDDRSQDGSDGEDGSDASPDGQRLHFYEVPSLQPCSSLNPIVHVYGAAWSPRDCRAAVTAVQKYTGRGWCTLFYMLFRDGRTVEHFDLDNTVIEPHGAFSWSPDGLKLGAVLRQPSGKFMLVIDDATTWLAWIELEPYLAQLPHPEALGRYDDWGREKKEVLWHWMSCSSRLVVWAQETDYHHNCGAFQFTLRDRSGEPPDEDTVMEEPVGQLQPWFGQHPFKPVWGFGGVAALNFSNSITLLRRPSSGGQAQANDPSSIAGLLPHQRFWMQICLGTRESLYQWSWDGKDGLAFAWAPNSCFLAVISSGFHREPTDKVLMRLVDGRCGAARIECVLLEQQGVGKLIRRMSVQWSIDGRAMCVSLLMARGPPTTTENHVGVDVRKFVLSFL